MTARSTFSVLIAFLGIVSEAANASARHEIDMTQMGNRAVGKSRVNESGNAAIPRSMRLVHVHARGVGGQRVRTRHVAHSYHCRHCVRTSGYRLSFATHYFRHVAHHANMKSMAHEEPMITHTERAVEAQRCTDGCESLGTRLSPDATVLTDAAAPANQCAQASAACSVGGILTMKAEQNASTLEETIVSNVALTDQTEGAAKLMLLIAATPLRASQRVWNTVLSTDQTVASVKY